jgi:hypothetical protein
MPWAHEPRSPSLDGMIDIPRGRPWPGTRRALLAASILLLAVLAVTAASLWPVSAPSSREVERRILANPRIAAGAVHLDGRDDLSPAMLEAMLDMAATYTFRLVGVTVDGFDVDRIGGRSIVPWGAVELQFIAGCRAHGATEVLQQTDRIYCGWP